MLDVFASCAWIKFLAVSLGICFAMANTTGAHNGSAANAVSTTTTNPSKLPLTNGRYTYSPESRYKNQNPAAQTCNNSIIAWHIFITDFHPDYIYFSAFYNIRRSTKTK